ncbi:MAG: hypothetical protein U0992_03300 [Planctomycetaceae bacterium]
MTRRLLADESGFIISAELVLVATILVIGIIVGLSEVQHAVVGELNDVADAIGSVNQSFSYSGFSKRDWGGGGGWGGGWGGTHAWTPGSAFVDFQDACDLNQCMLACNPPVPEAPKFGGYGHGGGGGYGGFAVAPRSVGPAPVPVPAPAEAPCVECPTAGPAGIPATPTPTPDGAGPMPQNPQ